MLANLSEECRAVLQLISDLQIDGREVVETEQALRRRGTRSDPITREPLVDVSPRVMFDPVPQWIISAEFHQPIGTDALSHMDVKRALVELRTRGIVSRVDMCDVWVGEYVRADGMIVCVHKCEPNKKGMKWFSVAVRSADSVKPRGVFLQFRACRGSLGAAYSLEPGWERYFDIRGETVAKRVADYLARQEAKGRDMCEIIRDEIAKQLRVSGGAVSKSPAWKEFRKWKIQQKMPSTVDGTIAKAGKSGDWNEVLRLQEQEQRRQGSQHID